MNKKTYLREIRCRIRPQKVPEREIDGDGQACKGSRGRIHRHPIYTLMHTHTHRLKEEEKKDGEKAAVVALTRKDNMKKEAKEKTPRTKDKDKREVEGEEVGVGEGVVVMCHKQGRSVVVVESEAMVKVVSSPLCPNVTTSTSTSNSSPALSAVDAAATATRNFTMELVNAGLESLSSVLSAIT